MVTAIETLFAAINEKSPLISILGPEIWDIVPSDLKQLETVNAFKTEIKKYKPNN